MKEIVLIIFSYNKSKSFCESYFIILPLTNQGVSQEVLCKIVEYIERNGELSKILFSDHGNGDYLQRMISKLFEISILKWKSQADHLDVSRLNWLYLFVSSGSAAIIKDWVKKEMQENPKDIEVFLEESRKFVEVTYLI